MKPPIFLVLLGLVISTLAQYGIPDDDDDDGLPPATYEPAAKFPAVVSRLQATPAPVVSSYTKYEEIEPIVMQSPTIELRRELPATVYATPSVKTVVQPTRIEFKELSPTVEVRREQPAMAYTPSAIKTVVQPTRIEIKEESAQYQQPLLFAVRTTEKPVERYPSLLERVLPTLSTTTTQIRFTNDYSPSQTGYTSEVRSEAIPIVKYVMDNDHRGNFHMETVTGDGTSKTVNGRLKDLGGSEGPVVVKTGSYSYTGDDGKVYSVDWTADEEGFAAFGSHIPKATR